MMKRLSILLAAWLALVVAPAWAQDVPKVGEASADAHIVRIAQSGWRTQGATLSFDGQTLYLSIRKAPKEDYDLFVCKKEKGKWQMPVRLSELSTADEEWSPSISSDERTLYFIRRGVMDAGTRKEHVADMLYCSERDPQGNWQPAYWMLLSNGTDSSPRILPDNKTLLFSSVGREASDSKKSETHRYWVRKLDKYNWTLPLLLPDTVKEDDMCTKVVTASGVVLNEGNDRPLMAQLNVYDALTKQHISEHTTTAEGAFLLALPAGRRYMIEVTKPGFTYAYFMVNPSEGEPEQQTLRLSQNIDVHLRFFNSETLSLLRDSSLTLPIGNERRIPVREPGYADTTLYFDTRTEILVARTEIDIELPPGHVTAHMTAVDAATGEALPYRIDSVVRCGQEVRWLFECPGYLIHDTIIRAPFHECETTYTMQLMPLQQATVVQLKNIQFEFNSHLLTEDSYSELELLGRMMRYNPTLRLELSAHTDDVGSDAYNNRLSARRAQSVVEYLTEIEGVEANRLIPHGYGKSRPLVPNDSDENRAVNRRVEFEIIEL